MAGRDLSSELFETTAPAEPSGKDLSSELFGDAPKAAEPVAKKDTVVNPLAAPAAPAAKPTPVEGSYGLMGEYIEPDVTPTKSDVGIMEGVKPAPADKTGFLPIRPEVRRSLIAEYEAASPAKRIQMEMQLPGVAGDVIREHATKFKARQAKQKAEFAQQERAGVVIPGLFDFDPSVEARTARLVGEGEKPEFARRAAEEAASADVPVGGEVAFSQRQGVLEPTKFDFEMFEKYRNANPIIRGAVSGYEGYKQGALGVNQAVADLLGFDEFARTQALGAEESRNAVQSMGQNPNYVARMFEGAVGSIAQQLPAMFGGAISGSEAYVLGSMFLQSFGQEYSEGKAKKLDPQDAAMRAGLFGSFEVLGERFGLKFQLDNIRRAASGMRTDELKDFLANTLKKELPGEYFTTTGQFLTDKSAIGLNKDATFSDYLQQMADTTVQTVMQSGLMTGGTKALGATVEAIAGKPTEEGEVVPTAESLMRQKGFLGGTPEARARRETPLETEAEDKATRTEGALSPEATRVEPTIEELTPAQRAEARQAKVEQIATDLVERTGMDGEAAIRIAEGRLRAQEAKEAEQLDKTMVGAAERLTEVTPEESRIDEITNDLISAGMNPTEAAQRAVLMAQQEAENDALAEQEGGIYAGAPITEAGGAGAQPPSARAAGVPTGGVAAPVTTGLAPAGTAVGKPAERKAVQPSTLEITQVNQLASQWDRSNRTSRSQEWMVGAAEANPSFEAVVDDGANVPAHGMAKAATLGQAVKDLVSLLTGGIDAARTLYYAPLTNPRAGVGAATGTASGVAYRDGPFIITFREGLTGQPTTDDITGVLVNPANVELVAPLQQMFPDLTIRSYDDVADVVSASLTAQEEAGATETIETLEAKAQREEAAGEAPAGRKRGRPTLAPEQREVSEQRRQQQRTAYKAVDKQVSNAERMLVEAAEPVDEAGAKDDAQLQEMYENKRTQRNAAIRTLYDISKTNRGKPGQRALALLNQYASTADIKNAAAGHELRKQRGLIATLAGPSKTIERAAAQTEPDAELGKVTNGAQALTRIIKTGNAFQRLLAKRLRGFVTNVKIVVVEDNQPIPDGIAKNPRYAKDWDRARAMYAENYKTGERVVYVRGASFGEAQGVNNITILHELLHAALNRKVAIARNEIESGKRTELTRLFGDLIDIMNSAGDKFNELAAQGKLPPHISKLAQFGEIFDDPREFIAYGMSDPAFQDFLKTVRGFGTAQPFYSRFVDSVRKFFGMDDLDTNALADLIDVTDSLLAAKAPRVALADLLPTPSLITLGDLLGRKKDETQAFAGDKVRAQPTVNARRMAELMGAKLYGDPTDIARVSVKELFQNAFDAVKGALENKQLAEGKINIKLDENSRTITITDNGLGMPASVMGNQFLQLAGTVKETKRASGGLGVAKMLFLFGNEKLEVVSLRDGVLARLVTTGEQLINAFDDPNQSPDVVTSSDPKVIEQYKNTMFPDGHGTAVVVKIPKTFVDPSNNEVRDIPFRSNSLSVSDSLEYSPLFDNIEVTVDTGYGPRTLPVGKNFPLDEYTSFANVKFAWGTARIYVTKKEVNIYGKNTHILSNGLWQFNENIKDGPGWGAGSIKRTFYVDVNPTVRPEDTGYPFELNRQNFSPAVKEDFKKIFNYITVIYQQQTLAGESKSFGVIQYVNSDGTLSTPEELEPQAPPTPTAFSMIKPDDKVEVIEGVMYVNGRQVPELTDADLKNATIRIDELTIPQDKIDTNRVMVHDNTLVKGSETKPEVTIKGIEAQLPEGWTIEEVGGFEKNYVARNADGSNGFYAVSIDSLIKKFANTGIQVSVEKPRLRTLSEVAREKFGIDYDKYLVGIGNIFMEMRNALSTEDNGRYTDIRKEAIGLSFDKEYYGVSIRVPFTGMYLNPATTSLKGTSRQMAVSMIGTMIHEMAHHKIRSHDANFASEMQRIMNLLETHPTYDLADAKKQLTNHVQKYINIFDFLDKEFTNGNLTARGNRFQDAGSYQARDDGPVGTVEGARNAGEEPGPDLSGWAEPSYQRTGKVGVGTGATSKAEEAGEQDEAVRTEKQINTEVDIALEKVRIGRQAEELAQQSKLLQALRDPRKILPAMRQLWKGATYAQRQLLVKMPTTEFLARWGGSYIPELLNTNVLLEKMGGLTQQLLNSTAILTQTIHKAFKEDKTLRTKLEDLSYASTLAQIDPTDSNATERSKKLDDMYRNLGAKGQAIFKLILQHYQDMSDYFAQLLDDQIANARLTTESQNQIMALVRKMYETGQRIRPYVPLVRRGDFWLAIGSGKHRQFFTFESAAERDAAAEAFAKERRTPLEQLKEDQDFVLGNDIGSLRRASFDSSGILKSLFDIIDNQDYSDPTVREELKDAVYQLYLTAMPEQSFRRQFINRKNITGFSTDLLRNISTTGTKMATQLSKIKYAPLLRNSISAAQDSIVGREELQPFITEMQARINAQLNPGTRTASDRVGDFLNRSAFIWYLSGASSALLQPIGVFQTATPILLSRYGQINGARELARTLKLWDTYGVWRKNPDGTLSFVAPSMSNAKGLKDDERRAIREALGRDVFQSTYASAMFGYKSTPTAQLGGVLDTTKRGLAVATGGLMHTTERLSREMVFLASYRLNRQAGKGFNEAVGQAVIDTNEALGNYGQYNRPLFMQKGLGKIALQFSMYPLHVTLFLMRNFKRMLPLLNKEGKWEATKIMFGTLGTTMVLAGAAGLPMFSIVMGMLGWYWRDEDKPQELKDMDYETWWRSVWLPETLGHIEIGGVKLSDLVERGVANQITGLDIASRTSLNDLWLRDTKATSTVRESVLALAIEKAGPSANMILSWADAYEAFGNGDYQKGIERMSPAFIRNFVLTYKYATEGAKDIEGGELILKDTFTTGELIGQSIGFRPDLLSNYQQLAFALKTNENRIKIERNKLMRNATREFFKGMSSNKWDGYDKQLDKIDKFNIKYPEYEIDQESLDESVERKEQMIADTETWGGMPINEKFEAYGAEAALNKIKKIEERNRQVLERRNKEGK